MDKHAEEEYKNTAPVSLDKVVGFFHRNPNPNDTQFHAFAKRNKYNPHEAEAAAYSLATTYVKFLKGGRANEKRIRPADVKPEELRMGIQVEKEHTPDIATARRISLDHLAEIKHYYSGLKHMEQTLLDTGDKQMSKKSELLNEITKNAFSDELQKIAKVDLKSYSNEELRGIGFDEDDIEEARFKPSGEIVRAMAGGALGTLFGLPFRGYKKAIAGGALGSILIPALAETHTEKEKTKLKERVEKAIVEGKLKKRNRVLLNI